MIAGSGRSPGEGNGYLLQYSCLENPMDRGAWRAAVRGAARVGHALVVTFPVKRLPCGPWRLWLRCVSASGSLLCLASHPRQLSCFLESLPGLPGLPPCPPFHTLIFQDCAGPGDLGCGGPLPPLMLFLLAFALSDGSSLRAPRPHGYFS